MIKSRLRYFSSKTIAACYIRIFAESPLTLSGNLKTSTYV